VQSSSIGSSTAGSTAVSSLPFSRESKLTQSGIKASKLDVIDEDLHVEDASEKELEQDRKKLKSIR
jgi:hypothetical protein